jgi:hypothetical protein
MIDMEKFRRESMRWFILVIIHTAQPANAASLHTHENIILSVIKSEYPTVTQLEIRRELDYLAKRDLIICHKQPNNVWFCELTRYGIDIVEYTLPIEPGIARPEK